MSGLSGLERFRLGEWLEDGMFLVSGTRTDGESFAHAVTGVFAKAMGALAIACAVAIPAGLTSSLKASPTEQIQPDGPSKSGALLGTLREQAGTFVARMKANDLSDIKADQDMLALARSAIVAMDARRQA